MPARRAAPNAKRCAPNSMPEKRSAPPPRPTSRLREPSSPSAYRCVPSGTRARRSAYASANPPRGAGATRGRLRRRAGAPRSDGRPVDPNRGECGPRHQERTNLEASIAERERSIAPLIVELEEARERELAAANALTAARSQLETVFTQLRDVEAAAAERAAVDAERRVQAEGLRAHSEQVDRELETARERAATLEIAAGAATQSLRERNERTGELEAVQRETAERAESAQQEASQAQDDLAETLTRHRDALAAVTGAESRLHTIEELENALEGHVPGTRAVVEAWQRGELAGIEGIVSNLVTIDERYARAMDVAFGARLSNVVTTTSEDAERCIEFLNRKEAGRATFLPLDTLRNREGRTLAAEMARVPGVIGYAHTLVETTSVFAAS